MTDQQKLSIGQAVDQLIAVLESFDEKSRRSILAIVCAHLGIDVLSQTAHSPEHRITPPSQPLATTASAQQSSTRHVDIRELKEQKQPRTSIEMAALVAYYLSESATGSERKTAIGREDLEKYFKQAGFKLPKQPRQTLVDAKAAGYFDSAERGQYRLNAVGYNLVAHGLPLQRSQGET